MGATDVRMTWDASAIASTIRTGKDRKRLLVKFVGKGLGDLPRKMDTNSCPAISLQLPALFILCKMS